MTRFLGWNSVISFRISLAKEIKPEKINLDGLGTEELDFKFNSGLLNFEKMSDAWTSHQELVLIRKISGDPLKKPSKITDYNWGL